MARRSKFVGSIETLPRDVKKKIVNSIKTAARGVVKDLRARGPLWTGEFRDSWEYEDSRRRRSTVPSMPLSRLAPGKDASLYVSNFASYADQAMDLVPYSAGAGEIPERSPRSVNYKEGVRPPRAYRGELYPESEMKERGEKGPFRENVSTAPLNWFDTYMNTGGFDKTFSSEADRGFRKPV
jgi:hypothetical protein